MKKKNLKNISIVSIIIIILIIIVGIFIKLTPEKEPPKIIIDNFSEYFPDVNNPDQVFQLLHSKVIGLTESPEKIPTAKAIIREGSLTTSNGYTTAIIDIDDLKISFQLKIRGSSLSEWGDLIISCPDKKDIIYPETVCRIYQNEGALMVVWEHDYLINNMLHGSSGAIIKQFLEEFILSDEEINSAPKAHDSVAYTVTINERSYHNISSSPNFIYTISASVVDGRNYQFYFNSDNNNNVAAFITNPDSEGHTAAKIFSDEDTRASLENWLRSLSNTVEIEFEEL